MSPNMPCRSRQAGCFKELERHCVFVQRHLAEVGVLRQPQRAALECRGALRAEQLHDEAVFIFVFILLLRGDEIRRGWETGVYPTGYQRTDIEDDTEVDGNRIVSDRVLTY